MTRHLILLLAIMAAGCATKGHTPSAWAPTCSQVGCVEHGLAGQAPVGAELTFSQCAGEGISTFRYVREASGWVLAARSSRTDPACLAAGRPN